MAIPKPNMIPAIVSVIPPEIPIPQIVVGAKTVRLPLVRLRTRAVPKTIVSIANILTNLENFGVILIENSDQLAIFFKKYRSQFIPIIYDVYCQALLEKEGQEFFTINQELSYHEIQGIYSKAWAMGDISHRSSPVPFSGLCLLESAYSDA